MSRELRKTWTKKKEYTCKVKKDYLKYSILVLPLFFIMTSQTTSSSLSLIGKTKLTTKKPVNVKEQGSVVLPMHLCLSWSKLLMIWFLCSIMATSSSNRSFSRPRSCWLHPLSEYEECTLEVNILGQWPIYYVTLCPSSSILIVSYTKWERQKCCKQLHTHLVY